MSDVRTVSPDIYHAEHVFQAGKGYENTTKEEEKTLSRLLGAIEKDVTSHYQLLSLASNYEVFGDVDITNTPLLEYIREFKRMSVARQLGEAKTSDEVSQGLLESHGTQIAPRELRDVVALRREYYQMITLGRECGRSKLTQMSGGIQVGGPGEATIIARKEYGDNIVNIHNHPEQSCASLVDLLALDGAVDVEIITTPDRYLIVKRSDEEQDYEINPMNWFSEANAPELMNRLYDVFENNGCFVDRFADDEDTINTYGIEMFYSVFSLAASQIMKKQVLYSTNENPGLFKVVTLPSDILPSLSQRVYGKDTDESKLYKEVADLVEEYSRRSA